MGLRMRQEGMGWELEVSRCKLLLIYIGWRNSKDPLYSEGNYIHLSCDEPSWKRTQKKIVYLYIYLIIALRTAEINTTSSINYTSITNKRKQLQLY